MDKIICLVGESGSGKSTIAELLEKEGYNYIQSYTNRPRRSENEKGHIFIDSDELLKRKEAISKAELSADVIAYTFFDGYHYWATNEQYINKGISLYVVDVAGVKELKNRIKDVEILIVYLNTDFDVRAKRMYARKYNVDVNNLDKNLCTQDEEILRRLQHDREAFKIIPCDYVIDGNRNIEAVLKDVEFVISNL